jgi:hypothetical protein
MNSKYLLNFSFLTFFLAFNLSASNIKALGGEIGQAREIEIGRKKNGGEIGQARFKEFKSLSKALSFQAPHSWTTLENKPLLIVSDPQSTSLVDSSERISFVLLENKQIEIPSELESELKKIHNDWTSVDIDGHKAFYRQADSFAEIWVYRQPHKLVKIEVVLSSEESVTNDIEHLLETLEIGALQ